MMTNYCDQDQEVGLQRELKLLKNTLKNIAFIIVSITSLPIVIIWEVVSRKEFIFLIIGIIIGYLWTV